MGIFIAQALGALVGRRIGDSIPVEAFRDSRLAHPLQNEPAKHVPNGPRSLLVDEQGVFVFRVLAVAVGGEGPDKLAPFPLVLKGAAHIHRGLVGVLFV